MYTRVIKRNQRWGLVLQQAKYYLVRPTIRDYTVSRSYGLTTNSTNLTRGSLFRSFSPSVASRNSLRLSKNIQLRSFSSEGDGRNASGEDKHVSLNKGSDLGDGKAAKESGVGHLDSHAQLGEQDQIEWLNSEKLASECKKKESPLLSRRERFRDEFLRRVQPWEKIQLSWETFPYYIHDHTKNILVECVTSHIRQKDAASVYGSRLDSSSGRILLQGHPGTELYQERLVRALSRDVQVPLLVLDSSVLAPYDFADEYNEDSESDGENAEAEADEGTTESEGEEDSGANSEEDSEAKADGSDNEEARLEVTEEDIKKIVPKLEELGELVAEELHGAGGACEAPAVEHSDKARRPARKGDRVKYVGPSKKGDAKHSPLTTGQRGEIFEVNGNRVAVVFDKEGDTSSEGSEKKPKKQSQKPHIHWIDVKDLKHDLDMQAEDGYIALKALNEVLQSTQPLIVYFPDSSRWLSRAVPKEKRNEFVEKVEEMFDKVSGPVVMICGRNKIETASKGREKFTMILPNFGRIARLPLPLKHLTEGLGGSKSSDDNEIYKLFTNVMNLLPPKEEDILAVFNKQLVEDRRIVVSRSNLNEILKALEENELLCTDLYQVNTDDVILTKQRAEKVVGWARNHYLSSCSKPLIKEDRLILPRESIEISVKRLKAQEDISRKPSHSLKNIAKDEFESNFVSAVVAPEEIGVKFDDVGALEHVKKTLNELVILPMRRPELFTRGNLLRPCKGILLFGPPGTGKTLLAKALATEAGANFISITGSSLTSKWFGDAEKLTKALFSFASKLAPVIIFVDEVDSLLGARGGSHEHEATRRMRNEFMAAWDGLRSKDSQRILILGATNRPFDLDDAVIRRLPRRIYVDLPDAENRLKILKIFLTPENLETGFEFEKLAKETEGYSGSDLKNLCIAAAYRPVQELLQEENKGSVANGGAPDLRPLSLDDFIQSKAKVSPSVSYDATTMNELRKWNEQYGEAMMEEDVSEDKTLPEARSLSSDFSVAVQESEEDEVLVSDEATIISEGLIVVDARSEITLLPDTVEIDNGRVLATAIIVNETTIDQVPTAEVLITSLNHDASMEATTASEVVIRLPEETQNVGARGSRSVYELECIPLWGTVSICGGRSEMEDAVSALPHFLKIPIKMLMGDHEGMSPSLTHLTSHFFGVYDGHGGPQVADYCHDRIHFALAEEIERIKEELCERNTGEGRQVQWEKVFTECYLKVDNEVKGKISRPVVGDDKMVLEAVSPETVGSTAVVALVCSSHIIVSNCGDSRAVLLRGKDSMPLSVDHKPDREDEYARIERAGGKVIQWQGARVSGVLAMSRSIGDEYLEPYVIPDPEVTFMPRAREDECLILASDGLWDVISNQDACDFARKRILWWHKKNGALPLAERGVGEDQACQAAADYLSKLAIQKGSKDNISIIVVDLKAQRKFKTRS